MFFFIRSLKPGQEKDRKGRRKDEYQDGKTVTEEERGSIKRTAIMR